MENVFYSIQTYVCMYTDWYKLNTDILISKDLQAYKHASIHNVHNSFSQVIPKDYIGNVSNLIILEIISAMLGRFNIYPSN